MCIYLKSFCCLLVPTFILLYRPFCGNRLLTIINGHFTLITYTRHWLTLHCHIRTPHITELLWIGWQERAHSFWNINSLCFVHQCLRVADLENRRDNYEVFSTPFPIEISLPYQEQKTSPAKQVESPYLPTEAEWVLQIQHISNTGYIVRAI